MGLPVFNLSALNTMFSEARVWIWSQILNARFKFKDRDSFMLFAILLLTKEWHLLPESVNYFFTWPGGVLKATDKKGASDVLVSTTMNLLVLAPQRFYICSKSLFPPQNAPF